MTNLLQLVRLPIVICLDVSGSMMGKPLEELHRGLELFFRSVKVQLKENKGIETCIIGFNHRIERVTAFDSIEVQYPPRFSASGLSYIGEAIEFTLDILEQQLNAYRKEGITYRTPWFILITDGNTNGSPSVLDHSLERISKIELNMIPVATGEDVNEGFFRCLRKDGSYFTIEDFKYLQFFQWLSEQSIIVFKKLNDF